MCSHQTKMVSGRYIKASITPRMEFRVRSILSILGGPRSPVSLGRASQVMPAAVHSRAAAALLASPIRRARQEPQVRDGDPGLSFLHVKRPGLRRRSAEKVARHARRFLRPARPRLRFPSRPAPVIIRGSSGVRAKGGAFLGRELLPPPV